MKKSESTHEETDVQLKWGWKIPNVVYLYENYILIKMKKNNFQYLDSLIVLWNTDIIHSLKCCFTVHVIYFYYDSKSLALEEEKEQSFDI